MTSPLWGITTFFNPGVVRSRVENYRAFRRGSRRQGLPLVTVELAFGDEPFVLEEGDDAEIVVQRRSSSVLWQKERLLNLALAAVPREARAVCWIDADVLLEDDDWIAECAALLEEHVLIQPFSAAVRLPKGGRPADLPGSEVGRAIPEGTGTSTFSRSVCSRLGGLLSTFSGTTGYAWCARRTFLDDVGFYDRCIVGGGDREFVLAAVYPPGKAPRRHVRIHHERLREHMRPWQARVYDGVGRRIGHRRGVLHHLWHGEPAQRGYVDRHAILAEHDFDPACDIALDDGQCWQWATDNVALVGAVDAYFKSRNEDG